MNVIYKSMERKKERKKERKQKERKKTIDPIKEKKKK